MRRDYSMYLKSRYLVTGLAVPMMMAAAGCGSSTTNNDQGVSFAALQWCAEPTCTTLIGFNETTLSGDITPGGNTTSSTSVLLQVENRLRNQFLRITKVECDYEVLGSTLPIPSESIARAGSVSPNPLIGGPQIGTADGSGNTGVGAGSAGGAAGGGAAGGGAGGGGAAGGGAAGGGANTGGISGPATGTGGRYVLSFPIISPDLFAYLNNNRSLLPETPIRLEAVCSVFAVSTAGDVFETNPVALTNILYDENQFPGLNSSTGNGGTIQDFDGSDPATGASTGAATVDDATVEELEFETVDESA